MVKKISSRKTKLKRKKAAANLKKLGLLVMVKKLVKKHFNEKRAKKTRKKSFRNFTQELLKSIQIKKNKFKPIPKIKMSPQFIRNVYKPKSMTKKARKQAYSRKTSKSFIKRLIIAIQFHTRRLTSRIGVQIFFLRKKIEYKHSTSFKKQKNKLKSIQKKKLSIKKAKKRFGKWAYAFDKYSKQPLFRKVAFSLSFVLLIFSAAFYWYVLYELPTPKALKENKSPQTTIIRDRNEKVLFRVYKNANRVNLAWEEIPDIVKNATIAIEDANFYKHHGMSLKSIMRAFLHNLNQENINLYQGGSTITQQLVKNKLVGSKKTYRRKVREILLSLWTELKFSKKEILTMYLNEVGYGGPAYGIEAASQMYFGIPAKNLTLAQAALLAGLPAAPTTFSPFGANSELAQQRQHQVLDRMLALGMVSEEQVKQAKGEKLAYAPQKIDIAAPHFVMHVKNQLVDKLGEGEAVEGGLDVVTSLDLDIQKKIEEIVKKQIDKIGARYNIHNAAVLVTHPLSGEILAMVGSVDYFDIENKGYVNVTNMPRQPGSSIKPVNYAYAFDHGYSPTSVILDAPVVYTAPGAESYKPINYDSKFHGNVTLRSALANSYNVPAVKLLNSYGVSKMLNLGKKMGIHQWNQDRPIGLALTLGGLEVTMLDMARAYGTIANMGKFKDVKSVLAIKSSKNENLTSAFYQTDKNNSLVGQAQAAENEQVISHLASYWLTDILSDNRARLPAFGTYSKLSVPKHKVAVKTGTSNNFRDNWTIGYTPDYLVAVWVGNNDGSFMNQRLVSGITGAAPIWHEVMSELLKDTKPKEFERPSGLVPVKICAVNGLLTCPNCPQEKIEYFTPDKVPTKKCFFKSSAECDAIRGQLEGKSEEEKKGMLFGCANVPPAKKEGEQNN